MTHNGYARSIRPVHTSADGDSIYALSVGTVAADCDMVGTLAADVMSEAILCAVCSAKSAYGYPALRDLNFLIEIEISEFRRFLLCILSEKYLKCLTCRSPRSATMTLT